MSAQAAQIKTFGGLEISADDFSFSLRLTGRLHADVNLYHNTKDDLRLTSGAFIRRARIGIQGNLNQWEYALEFDNSTNEADLTDANIRRAVGPGQFSIGQFKVYESLEQVSSSNDILFMERPYATEAAPGFQIGVAYNGAWQKIGYAGTVYNLREASDGEDRPIDSGVGGTARAYWAPLNDRTIALHMGGSYARESSDSNGRQVEVSPIGRAETYRSEDEDGPEVDFRFDLFDIDDVRVDVERMLGEFAFINGPLLLQGEYLDGKATADGEMDDDFSAWYAQVGYVVTGEYRRYDFRPGRIRRPEPARQWGAIEVGARYQQAERENAPGAKLTLIEYALTYYADTNVRFMLNYGIANNKLLDDRPRLVSMRAQFDF